MAQWIALFRGINVGGNNILPMAELREQLAALGLEDVRTYIQSGNVVFRSAARSGSKLGAEITAAIETSHGFRASVLILSEKEYEKALAKNPFTRVSEGKHLHFHFLFETPKRPDLNALAELATDSESFECIGKVFYLHAPDGIARSKLAAQADKYLGAEGTARNLNTVRKLADMLAS